MNRVLTGLERQLYAVRNDETLSPREMARRLGGIERALKACVSQLHESSATSTGSALLEELHEWRDVCSNLKLTASARRGEELTKHFFEQLATAWEQSVQPILEVPTAETCFNALVHTTSLQIQVRGEFPTQRVGRSTFESIRHSLRQALLKAVDQFPPDEDTRKRWATKLRDRADMLLTSLDGLPPERGVGRLTLLSADLEWFLNHIETDRTKQRRQVKRKWNQLLTELQERQLQSRLEQKFGKRFVAVSERVILLLIFLVVGLMAVEMLIPLSHRTHLWFHIIDAGACVLFLIEFFTKLAHVEEKWRWFRRHVLIDFVPSIPFSLLFLYLGIMPGGVTATEADPTRATELARVLRLPRLARYARILRPIIRVLRGLGLLSRGLDRLARQHGHVLNQNVILYPNRQELEDAYEEDAVTQSYAWRLQSDVNETWQNLVASAPEEESPAIADARLDLLETALQQSLLDGAGRGESKDASVKEIPAEVLIDRMLSITALEVEASLGASLVGQLSRMVRVFSKPPLVWLPIIRSVVPRISEEMTNGEIVAASARRAARTLQFFHDGWFWLSDLYGTVTPSQFVDRLGSTLVKSSMRPAYRLVMFGGFLLLTQLLLVLTSMALLRPVEAFLSKVLGPTVLLMGGICVFVLAIGWWLQRVAREATEFYERSVKAQYLSLTEVIRTRHLERDTQILYERALRPLWGVQYSIDSNMQLQHFRRRAKLTFTGEGETDAYFGMENTLLLYHDWLDGAMFTEVDTRTTGQLLGNPSVRQILALSHRISKKAEKELSNLDLTRQKSLTGGPYLWFNFVTRAIAHSVAQQIVEYNQRAIPLDELDLTDETEQRRYRRWLRGPSSIETGAELPVDRKPAEASYLTTTFTALHFLDHDPRRDDDIAFRFGDEVREKLQRDRALLMRKIFGTFPMHSHPKEDRVVNLYSIYSTWLSGGRALFLPWTLLLQAFRVLGSAIKWSWRSIQEIRDPERRAYTTDAATAPFRTAVRKIERFRGPIVVAAMRIRMLVDPEYLAVPIPGQPRSRLDGADVNSDLDFLQLDPSFADHVEAERERIEADVRRLERMIEKGLLQRLARERDLPDNTFNSERHIRALTIAYVADYHGIRGLLSAGHILQEVCRHAIAEPIHPRKTDWFGWLRKRRFHRFWKQNKLGTRRERYRAWRAIQNDVWDSQAAVDLTTEDRARRIARGEKILGTLLRHPNRIIEQLLTIRVIQTLAVLDVLNYREHVFKLGDYQSDGEHVDALLNWQTIPEAEEPPPEKTPTEPVGRLG